MNRDEVISLLQVAIAYDNRDLDELLIRGWCESAHRAQWTFDQALDAIHEHYAHSTAWLMPGHITQGIKAARYADPETWLHDCWNRMDLPAIEARSGLTFCCPDTPDGVTDIVAWNMQARRDWIAANWDAILACVAKREPAAIGASIVRAQP